jgi:hypothetical protein
MDTQYVQDNLEPIWSDVAPIERPVVAHYTTIQNFENILRDGEIWFSNPLLMNDYEEVRFGIANFLQSLEHSSDLLAALKSKERIELFNEGIRNVFRDFDYRILFDVYAFCLSEHDLLDNDGRLSMWRAYAGGGSGVALIFDTSKLPPPTQNPFIFAPVIYATRAQRADWIWAKIKQFSSLVASADFKNEQLQHVAWYLFERIKVFSLFSKHDGFNEEREWRIVYLPDRDQGSRYKQYFKHSLSQNTAVPKMKLPMFESIASGSDNSQNFTISEILNKVIIGPTNASALSLNSVKRMCNHYRPGNLADKVFQSTIPYRPS